MHPMTPEGAASYISALPGLAPEAGSKAGRSGRGSKVFSSVTSSTLCYNAVHCQLATERAAYMLTDTD